MLNNRISRVVLPFLAFILILYPMLVFSYNYTMSIFLDGSMNNALEKIAVRFSRWDAYYPQITFHLWFLYYLILITFTTAGLGLLLKKLPKISSKITEIFNWIITKPIIRLLAFGAISTFIYYILGIKEIVTSSSLIPDFNTLIYYSYFYIVGWVLFKSKQHLNSFMKYDWMSVLLGLLLFLTFLKVKDLIGYELTIFLKSIMVWSFIFGITGLFVRYGSKYSSKMRYISDASYWIYLMHLPFTILIPSFIVNWPISVLPKFLIVLCSTTVICFITYHYLVRNTFIGKFLNGRKFPIKNNQYDSNLTTMKEAINRS